MRLWRRGRYHTGGVSAKTSAIKSEPRISRASEEVTSPRPGLGLLRRSEREQSSARGLRKKKEEKITASSAKYPPGSEPADHSFLPPPTLSGIKDALGIR